MKKQNRFKSSIKWRFTGIFMGLIAVLLIAILMANSFFLEGSYTTGDNVSEVTLRDE